MLTLNLGNGEAEEFRSFVASLDAAGETEVRTFAANFETRDAAAWRRFARGVINHPITWWIGLFQLSMQSGVWGTRYRAAANVRADRLWHLGEPLRKELRSLRHGSDAPLLSAIVRYNLGHRKADISGRLLGGEFTNYAALGGAYGSTRLSTHVKRPAKANNFIIASYGAAIKAVAQGHRTVDAIIQSVLTGRPENLPLAYRSMNRATVPPDQAKQVVGGASYVLSEVMSLTRVAAGPVPIKEFCSRRENSGVGGLCK